ncbi:zinc ribbon domain-containing protein [Mesorhizobium sp. M0220]|uniref:zinc ribbon domain-containing protein n=1 Tax=Mesorhizobium sp. M0220 TaxID=2956920 RepID=UPI00333864B7
MPLDRNAASSRVGGRALLAGLITCGRCGRRLGVVYLGRPPGHPYYRCGHINQMLAKPRCMTFGASRIDPGIGKRYWGP